MTLITVAQYSKIADPPGGRYELHHGELVLVPPPQPRHAHISRNILFLLAANCKTLYVDKEFAFRPRSEYEVWVADVAGVRNERWTPERRSRWLMGSPELVIEMLSPSNKEGDMQDRVATCFAGGCLAFWIVDAGSRSVRVIEAGGKETLYGDGDLIPLMPWSEESVAVASVFAD